MTHNLARRVRAAEVASFLLLCAAVVSVALQSGNDDVNEPGPGGPAIVYARVAAGSARDSRTDIAALRVLLPDVSASDALPGQDWAAFDGPYVQVKTNTEQVEAIAARTPNGAVVGIRNTWHGPVSLRVSAALPRGRYSAARMVIAGGNARIERLQSVALDGTGEVAKLGRIEPGASVVYRFENPVSAAATSYRRVRAMLAALTGSRRAHAKRMENALRECPWTLTQLVSTMPQRDSQRALKTIHRTLLTVGHAQSICRNVTNQGRIPAATGRKIRDEMARLERSLVECSVAVLDLVPSITEEASPSGDPADRIVHASVRNAGARSVSAVKLWATGTGKAAVEPREAASFGTLAPRQSASAEFRVRRDPNTKGPSALGDLSYYSTGSPAHLQFRPY